MKGEVEIDFGKLDGRAHGNGIRVIGKRRHTISGQLLVALKRVVGVKRGIISVVIIIVIVGRENRGSK